MSEAEAIVEFWLHEVGLDGWYVADDAIDTEIRTRFLTSWEAAERGEREFWLSGPGGSLAYLILTDQFPRNMFRGDARSFATDARARAAARLATDKGWDLAVPEPERVFYYMPFEHSEDLADQDHCIALLERNLVSTRDEFVLHARAHREIINRFGRFPFRNAALGRASTDAEVEFMANGGYGRIVEALKTGG